MPIYSYKCSDCEHSFDAQQSMSDNALAICPKCQGKLKKVVGQVGVTFKGSGFYRTDNAKTSKSSD